jgi:hypothetical protein
MRNVDDALVFYLPAEAAKILRCSEWWLKEQARKDRIPYCWIGGRYKFTPEHLKAIARTFEHGTSDRGGDSEKAQPRRASPRSRLIGRAAGGISEPAQLIARVPPRARRASGSSKAA